MKKWIWVTAVSLITLLFAAVSCGSAESEQEALLEIAGPTFLFFYTDN